MRLLRALDLRKEVRVELQKMAREDPAPCCPLPTNPLGCVHRDPLTEGGHEAPSSCPPAGAQLSCSSRPHQQAGGNAMDDH